MLPLLTLLLGCAADGPMPLMGEGDDFFSSPWPSFERRNALGGPSLVGFPESDDIDLLGTYVELGEEVLAGASTVAPTYFAFDAPLDTTLLPDPLGSLSPEATVFLMNVDPRSPGWGQRVPIRWDFQLEETTYQAKNLLAVGPLIGTPLDADTLYAVVITTELAARSPAMDDLFDEENPDWGEAWEPLRLALFEQGLPVERVAAATVFRTDDPTAEMRSIAWRIREHLGHQDLEQELVEVDRNQFFTLYEGRIYLPIWQHGERPYASEGGGFVRGEGGQFEIDSWERVAFSLSIPNNGDRPDGGWPLALYAHGTGGDYMSCCYVTSGDTAAAVLSRGGIAVMGVSQPLHGDRATPSTSTELHTFNFLNPASGRSTFRQGALDTVYLAHVMAERAQVFTTPDGELVPIDPDNILFMGHSQGGITGALALPFIGDDVRAAMLSGAGGGLSLTLVYRKQGGLDIEALIREVLDFEDHEVLGELHPTVALIQTLTDVTDPLNYSASWYAQRGPLGLPPVSVLMTEGLLDEHTPPMTTEALAASGGLPVLEPASVISEGHVAQGLAKAQPMPAVGNLTAWDGSVVTGGLMQYPNNDHFAIFDNDSAEIFYRRYLQSAVDGQPALGQ